MSQLQDKNTKNYIIMDMSSLLPQFSNLESQSNIEAFGSLLKKYINHCAFIKNKQSYEIFLFFSHYFFNSERLYNIKDFLISQIQIFLKKVNKSELIKHWDEDNLNLDFVDIQSIINEIDLDLFISDKDKTFSNVLFSSLLMIEQNLLIFQPNEQELLNRLFFLLDIFAPKEDGQTIKIRLIGSQENVLSCMSQDDVMNGVIDHVGQYWNERGISVNIDVLSVNKSASIFQLKNHDNLNVVYHRLIKTNEGVFWENCEQSVLVPFIMSLYNLDYAGAVKDVLSNGDKFYRIVNVLRTYDLLVGGYFRDDFGKKQKLKFNQFGGKKLNQLLLKYGGIGHLLAVFDTLSEKDVLKKSFDNQTLSFLLEMISFLKFDNTIQRDEIFDVLKKSDVL